MLTRSVLLALALGLSALALLTWAILPRTATTDGATVAVAGAGGDAAGRKGGGAARGGSGGGRGGAPGRSRESLVVTDVVTSATADDRLLAMGDGDALASVTVVPRASGVLQDVYVTSGKRVAAGELLATLDREAEEISRDLALRAVDDAEALSRRLQTLVQSNAGTRAELDNAENALAAARLTLRDAELKLARRDVLAPISGVVGIVPVEPGDFVVADSEIVTIDDRSTLVVDFRVPERFADDVQPGQPFEATSFAVPGVALTGEISAVGSRVERDSRTLGVRGVLDNSGDRLRPGMSFSVTLRFAGDTRPAVDPLAVQWDSLGAFVWLVAEGRAERTPIRIVRRDPERVLVEGALVPGDTVVTEGVMSLRDGAAVRESGEAGARVTEPGKAGSGDAGAGKAGTGKGGREKAGTDKAGMGKTDPNKAGMGKAGMGKAGTGKAEAGTKETGRGGT